MLYANSQLKMFTEQKKQRILILNKHVAWGHIRKLKLHFIKCVCVFTHIHIIGINSMANIQDSPSKNWKKTCNTFKNKSIIKSIFLFRNKSIIKSIFLFRKNTFIQLKLLKGGSYESLLRVSEQFINTKRTFLQ